MDIVIGLVGGLAIFIFGMQFMSTGLKNAAGDRMQSILEKLTGNAVLGVGIGALVTALIQSSSATTVMVVGFVNAGMMTLKQALAVIVGANIGTTITSQIISFKISQFIMPLIFVGFLLYFMARRPSIRYSGAVILGFGILMHGLDIMGTSLAPLRDYPAFSELMILFSVRPWLGLLAGIVVTILLQSSSAATGVLIALAGTGLIPLESAVPMILGTNIGTCVTAILSSIGTTRVAKRAALGHVLFNLLGSLLFMLLLDPFTRMIYLVSGDMASVPRLIANAHTSFNLINALIFIPFLKPFTRLIYSILPELEEEKELNKNPVYLDERMLKTPEIATSLARKELLSIGNLARKNARNALNGLVSRNPKKLRKVMETEPVIDRLEKQTAQYLSRITQGSMSPHMSALNTALIHVGYDLERIGDHGENIAQIGQDYLEDKFTFSQAALEEMEQMSELIQDCIKQALKVLETSDPGAAAKVRDYEREIDLKERQLRQKHTDRLQQSKCLPEAGLAFLDILTNMERIGDHCQNIANVIMEAEQA